MLTESASSTNTMQISFMVIRNIQIHDEINVLSVNPTRCLKYTQQQRVLNPALCCC